jgi:hypothetical protein
VLSPDRANQQGAVEGCALPRVAPQEPEQPLLKFSD